MLPSSLMRSDDDDNLLDLFQLGSYVPFNIRSIQDPLPLKNISFNEINEIFIIYERQHN